MADGEESLYRVDQFLIILTDQSRFPRGPGKPRIHKEKLIFHFDSLQARFSFQSFFYALLDSLKIQISL